MFHSPFSLRPLIHWSSKMAPHKLTTQTLDFFIAKVTYVLLPWQHEEIGRESEWHSLSTCAQLLRFFSAPAFIHIWRFLFVKLRPHDSFHWKAHNFAYFITVRSHYFYTIMQYTSHFININFSSFSGLYIHLFKKPCEGYVPQIFLFFHFNFCSTLLAGSKHVLYLSWEGFQHSILRPLWASCPH